MQDADTFVPAFDGDADEIFKRALKPGGHHHAVRVPHGLEALPITGIAPHGPTFDQVANAQLLGQCVVHVWFLRVMSLGSV